MNDIILTLGLESWKPLVNALLLPPAPLLLLVLVGARLMFRRRLLAWLLILIGVLGVWFSATTAVSKGLTQWLLQPPPPLSESEIADLKRAPRTAIVVLGGGRRPLAPEYGVSTLSPRGIERLRYGLWLSRETGLPVAFSGGVAHGGPQGQGEAEIAARIAEREYGRPLRWTETESRDTRENAQRSVALLEPQGIDRIVLVTHEYHMARAMQNFQRAIGTRKLTVVPAPMGMPAGGALQFIDWLPTVSGFERNRLVMHEWLGRVFGA
jgi:uncharacterized SAM-binding protein YcdF (DUF218 family)